MKKSLKDITSQENLKKEEETNVSSWGMIVTSKFDIIEQQKKTLKTNKNSANITQCLQSE